MALKNNPHVFPFEGRLWVSEIPPAEMLGQLTEQRAWDATNERRERWGFAIAIGAVAGVLATYGFGYFASIPPVVNLFLLPVGFAVGAVLGSVVNRSRVARMPEKSGTARPVTNLATRIPRDVVRAAPDDATAAQLIDWSQRGYVPR